MAITPLPPAPNRGMDPDEFVEAADAFLGALPTFAEQVQDELDSIEAPTMSDFTRSIIPSEDATAWRGALGLALGSNVQAFHPNLTAVSGLSLVADRLIYANGAGTLGLATLTSFARTLLDDTDGATARATLGVTIGSNVQAYDATLTALAGVSTAANKLIYATAADAFSTTDLSAFARTLLDDADAATARATLGLAIGANVQAYDATLSGIAGVTTAADQLIYATGLDSFATTALTSFARTLLDDTTATAARATLGLTIGSNVQAYHANLAAFAGLSLVADRLVYATGAGALGLTTLTAFARTLLDDADASSARATLSLGTASTRNTGTSGATVPLLDGDNTHSGDNTFSGVAKKGSAGHFLYHGSASHASGKVTVSTSDPSGGADGDLWLKVA